MPNIKLAENFMDIIPKSMWAIRFEMRSHIPKGLSLMQSRVLIQIDKGITSTSKLAEMIGVSNPAMSRLLDQLETKEYISRTRPIQKKNSKEKCDRRQIVITLTSKGKNQIQSIRSISVEQFTKKFNLLNSEEKLKLLHGFELLEKVIST